MIDGINELDFLTCKQPKSNRESVVIYVGGPTAPAGHEGEWIKTLPGKGWFVYFRIYGPEKPAFDGTWKPGDFELVK